MTTVTKAQLLQGDKFSKTIDINGNKIAIRAISDSELNKVDAAYIQEIKVAGISITDDKESKVDDDQALVFGVALKNRMWKICALTLSINEKWTPEEASMLPPVVIERIVEEAETLSTGKEGQIEKFRRNKRRSEAVDSDDARLPIN
jgi:hypothetical protein